MSDQNMLPRIVVNPSPGLTAAEAQARLKQFGPNARRRGKRIPLRQFLQPVLGAHSVAVGSHHCHPVLSRRGRRGSGNRRDCSS